MLTKFHDAALLAETLFKRFAVGESAKIEHPDIEGLDEYCHFVNKGGYLDEVIREGHQIIFANLFTAYLAVKSNQAHDAENADSSDDEYSALCDDEEEELSSAVYLYVDCDKLCSDDADEVLSGLWLAEPEGVLFDDRLEIKHRLEDTEHIQYVVKRYGVDGQMYTLKPKSLRKVFAHDDTESCLGELHDLIATLLCDIGLMLDEVGCMNS